MPAQKTADGTAALDKALDVLDAVGHASAGLSQGELGERLGLPRTTLYRLLGSLVARGLLRRDPLRRVYCIGQRCLEYARAAYAMPDLVAAAGSELRALRDMTGETTYVAALDGLEVVSLERCDGAHDQRSSSAVGTRKPLHCTSQGKAILAALPAAQRDEIVRVLVLTPVTPHSITDRRRLQADLKRTAERGWSIDEEEIVPGVRCCGAAIIDAQGRVRGAISVAGPAFRLTAERVDLLGPEVAAAAQRIGAQLSAGVAATVPSDVRAVPGDWAFNGALPFWCAAAQALYWADTLAPAIHRADAEGDAIVARLDAPVQALLPHEGGAAVQLNDAWYTLNRGGALSGLAAWPRRRLTAACVAPDGSPWACWADGERWRVGPLRPDDQLAGGWRLGQSASALAWDAAGRQLYVAIAGSGELQVATVGQTALRRLATVPKGSGQLAGLAGDARGGVWASLRGGWSVVRLAADGSVERVLALPVPCPVGLAVGGSDGELLYITSARDAVGRDALDAAPLSGRLFAATLGNASV